MAQRFQEKIQLQRVNTSTGAAQGLMSLSDRLNQFKSLGSQAMGAGFQVLKEEQTERGLKSGKAVPIVKKEGVTQAPEFKEVPRFLGAEQKAHNIALKASYLASLDNDNREAMNEIFTANKDNTVGFNESVGGYIKGVVSGVDPSVRTEVLTDLERTSSMMRTKVHNNEIEKQKRVATIELKDNIKSATDQSLADARNDDKSSSAENMVKAFETLNAGAKAGLWTQTEADTQKREIEKGATSQGVFKRIDDIANENIPAAFKAVDEMSQKIPKGFSPDEWRAVVTEAHGNVARKRAALQARKTGLKKEIDFMDSVERGISFDSANPGDPAKGSQDRKDINNAFIYTADIEGWNDLPIKDQFNKTVDFIKTKGMIPSAVTSKINATFRSGAPDLVLVYSELIKNITEDPNTAVISKDIPSDAKAMSMSVIDSTSAGIDLETATEIARKNIGGLSEPKRDEIRVKVQEQRLNMPALLEGMVDDHYDPSWIPFFGEEPDINQAMMSDFGVNFSKFMTKTDGDVGQSQKLAFDALTNVWGATSIGGDKRLMKYSPETFYAVPNVDNKWMEEQFESDMKSVGLDPGEVKISINFETTRSKNPSWSLLYKNKAGQFAPLTYDDGTAKDWSPDFTKTRKYIELKSLPTRRIESTVKLREEWKNIGDIEGVGFISNADLYRGKGTKKEKGTAALPQRKAK